MGLSGPKFHLLLDERQVFGRPSANFDPLSPKAKNYLTNYEYEPNLYC